MNFWFATVNPSTFIDENTNFIDKLTEKMLQFVDSFINSKLYSHEDNQNKAHRPTKENYDTLGT